jgi:hypothetical protein
LLWYKSVDFGCFYITSGSQVVKEKSGIIEGFTFFLDEPFESAQGDDFIKRKKIGY